MLWFRRSRQAAGGAVDDTAVPLAPSDARALIEALYEADRLRQWHRQDGPGYAADQAEAVLRAAGIAAALGDSTVPVLVATLPLYKYVLATLQQYAPHGPHTQWFAQALPRLHFLSGVARIRGWRARHHADGLEWAGIAPTAQITSALAQDPASQPMTTQPARSNR